MSAGRLYRLAFYRGKEKLVNKWICRVGWRSETIGRRLLWSVVPIVRRRIATRGRVNDHINRPSGTTQKKEFWCSAPGQGVTRMVPRRPTLEMIDGDYESQ